MINCIKVFILEAFMQAELHWGFVAAKTRSGWVS